MTIHISWRSSSLRKLSGTFPEEESKPCPVLELYWKLRGVGNVLRDNVSAKKAAFDSLLWMALPPRGRSVKYDGDPAPSRISCIWTSLHLFCESSTRIGCPFNENIGTETLVYAWNKLAQPRMRTSSGSDKNHPCQ